MENSLKCPLSFLLSSFKAPQKENITGIPQNIKPLVIASLLKDKKKALIVTKDSLAERLKMDISYFIPDTYLFLPEDETAEAISDAREILKRLKEKKRTILIMGVQSILKPVSSIDALDKEEIYLSLSEEIGFTKTIDALNKIGYTRIKRCEEKGEIAIRGGILDIWPINYDYPLRIEFDGDKIFSLRLFDPISQISFKNKDKAIISPCFSERLGSIFDYLENNLIALDEEDALKEDVENEGFLWEDIRKRIKNPYSLTSFGEAQFKISQPPSFNSIEQFISSVKSWGKEGKRIIICCGYQGQTERMKDLLMESGVGSLGSRISVVIAPISAGFSFDRTIVLTHNEIFGKPQFIPRKIRRINPISSISELKIGNYAVHINYGIGRYLGIKSLNSCGRIRDFILLEYKDNDKLYIPCERIDLVEKYIGPSNPVINRLGDGIWERTKKKVSEDALEYAKKLLSIYAERKAFLGHRFSCDTLWQNQLETGFIHQETPDQIKAIKEIKEDMESNKPMDRLLVGDVGFGKTEIALRTGFKAVMDGFQVAILAPTTILAHQHYNTFCQRLEGFPINIGLLSRFKKKSEKEIIEGLKNGSIDIVIGTHRLIQKDISFKNLGLLIIDEEQRFGVVQKEKLKEFKKNIDCLYISATPIPRTLYFGISNIIPVSIINTPPIGRQEIITHIEKFSPEVIERAILKEVERGGQVFFVHNSIETIEEMADYIKALIPKIEIGIAHGRLKEKDLEETMIQFLDRKINILLSTSIIASGLDIPSANTIIINNAQEFGLADIYQLRGRVGRRNERAYCYLLYPNKKLKEKEKQRLLAIQKFFSLGSSLSLALSDLEIRGAGNILGKEQSGNIQSVGLSLYTRLLSEAVAKIKGIKTSEKVITPIDIPENAFIPEDYIPDEAERFNIYKRLSSGYSKDKLKDEIKDRFGKIPEPTLRLLEKTRSF
ncbi:MAG: transcription-repair coupling factor [bacterium]